MSFPLCGALPVTSGVEAVGLCVVLYASFESFVCVSMQSFTTLDKKTEKDKIEPVYVFFMIVDIFINAHCGAFGVCEQVEECVCSQQRLCRSCTCLMGRT